MSDTTTSTTVRKPKKPFPDFPLFAHATGRWAKKVKGKLCYFGPWDDPSGALARWEAQREDLLAGNAPSAGRAEASGTDDDRPARPYAGFPLFVRFPTFGGRGAMG